MPRQIYRLRLWREDGLRWIDSACGEVFLYIKRLKVASEGILPLLDACSDSAQLSMSPGVAR